MRDPVDDVLIALSNGGHAVVSAADAAVVAGYRWYRSTRGYAIAAVRAPDSPRRRTVWMHRLITAAPHGCDVDHADHDRLNNRRSNLRVCTRAENLANARRHRDSRSPYKGVTWRADTGRWTARIMVCGRVHHLGCFDTAPAAADAYARAAVRLVGPFACAERAPAAVA